MNKAILLVSLVVMAFSVSCGGGGSSSPDPDKQELQITSGPGPAGVRTLHLLGPKTTTFGTVTYYVFGSNEDFGENANVPLQADRLDEAKVGPLSTGEEMRNFDLSPWDAYSFIYVRALGVVPNRAYAIRLGRTYEFTTN